MLTDELYNSSVDMLKLLNDLILHYRNLMIVKTVKGEKLPIVCSSDHLSALKMLADGYSIEDIILTLRFLQDTTIKMQTGNRRSEMELMLVKLCSPSLRHDIDSLERRIAALEKIPRTVQYVTKEELPLSQETPIIDDAIITEEVPVFEEIPEISEAEMPSGIVASDIWLSILDELGKSAPLLRGILNNSRAFIEGEFFLVDCENPQFAELMNSSNGRYKEILRRAIETVTGCEYKLGPYRKRQKIDNNDPLQALREKLAELEVPQKSN